MKMQSDENKKYFQMLLVDTLTIRNAAVKVAELVDEARQGNPLAQINMGYAYMGKDWKKAFDWFSKSAAQGNLQALEMLGVCYANGYGVEQDEPMAVKLWESVVEEEPSPLALFELGDCYLSGAGCEQNSSKGTDYLQRAVDQGFLLAEGILGLCYLNGDGVQQDERQAVVLMTHYCSGLKKPSPFVLCTLGRCFKDGIGTVHNYGKAEACFLRAAELDYPPAEEILLDLYMDEPVNPEKVLFWLKKVADRKKRPDIPRLLGYCYLNGSRITEKDPEEAVHWFRMAADQGDMSAICELGICYLYGDGVEKDKGKAAEYIFRSANAGCMKAQDILGQAYSRGILFERDLDAARKWYQKAAGQGSEHAQKALEELDATDTVH